MRPPEQPLSLAALREEYTLGGLHESDLLEDPIAMLRDWMAEAVRAGLYDPTAMVLATVSGSGAPSARMVLCKGLGEQGLDFFTNYSSRKGQELGERAPCAVVFPWHPLQRQVRVEGVAHRLTDEENDAYFASRPRESQLGAWASPQSAVVDSRDELDRRYAEAVARFGDGPIARPPHWGGYRVVPDVVEFWQGRQGRMHDRFQCRRDGRGWRWVRLAP